MLWNVNMKKSLLLDFAKIAILRLIVLLLKRYMKFIISNVKEYIWFAVIAVKFYVITCLILFTLNLAKLAAIIRNVASYVINFTHYMLRIISDFVHIANNVYYHV